MATVSEAFSSALGHHQAGRLQQAEQIYQQILQSNPNHADSLHLLGVIAHQAGQHETAVEAIARAIAVSPKQTHYHNNISSAYRALGQLDQAAHSLQRALRLDPHYAEAHKNLGIVHKSCGRIEKAVESLKRAVELKPDYAEAYNDLGGTLSDLGKFDEAAECFRAALMHRPAYAAALNNLGVVLKKQGKLRDALECYRRVVDIHPDYSEPHVNLGIALSELGHLVEAANCYRRAIRLNPHSTAALNNLAKLLQERGQIEAACSYFERALTVEPDSVVVHNNLASAYVELGRFGEAVLHSRCAIALDPHNIPGYRVLVESGEATAAEIACLQLRLQDAGLTRDNRVAVLFALGRQHDRDENFEGAFGYFAEANRLKGFHFDADQFAAYVDRLIKIFDRDFFATHGLQGHSTKMPIFIVGMPRSGTTLVEQILSSHPHVGSVGESTKVTQFATSALMRQIISGEQPPVDAAELGRAIASYTESYLTHINQPAGHWQRVVDKMPGNAVHLGLIALMFPNAQIIHCRRDPRDSCLSCYFQNFSDVDYAFDLEDLGTYYRHLNRLMAHWQAVLPIHVMDMQYEELVAEPEAVIRGIVEQVGLPWDERCLAFQTNPRAVNTASQYQVRSQIHTKSVGRWKHYEPYLRPLLDTIIDNLTDVDML